MASNSNTGNNRWSMDSWDRDNVRYIRKISRSLMTSAEERELLEENKNTCIASGPIKKPEIKRQDVIYEKSIPKKILNKFCPPPTPRRNSVTKLSAGAAMNNPMDLENCYLIDILTVRNESVMTYKKSPKLSEIFSKNSESSSDIESETSSTSIGLDLEGTTSESSCNEDDLCSKMSSKHSYASSNNPMIMKGKSKDRNTSIISTSTKYPGSTGTGTSYNSGFSPFPSSSISSTAGSSRFSSSIISKKDEKKQTQVQDEQNNIKDELCPFCCNNKSSSSTTTPASTIQIQTQTGPSVVGSTSSTISNKEKYFYLGEEVEERPLRMKEMSPSGQSDSPCSEEMEIMSQNIPEPMEKLPSSPYYVRLSRDIPKILQQPPPTSRNFAMNKQGLLMVDYSSNWDGLETFTKKLNLKS